MTTTTLYPWQQTQWQQIITRKQQNALPHALQLMGAEGLGKKEFALQLAKHVLCLQNACGQCHACHLIQANTHPDLLIIELEEDSKAIKIDQIREAVQFVSETALQGVHRVVIIPLAQKMNIAAANALLKTLEEPPRNTLIILISDVMTRLPATIASRCQKLLFHRPEKTLALNWLKDRIQKPEEELQLSLNLANGAPLRAASLLESGHFTLRQEFYQHLTELSTQQADPLTVAAHYQDHPDSGILFYFLLLWTHDLLRFCLSQGEADLVNLDFRQVFARLSQQMSHEKIIRYLDQVQEASARHAQGMNLNRQLVFEELFIQWVRYAAS